MTEQEILKATIEELREQAELLGVDFDKTDTIEVLQQSVAAALGVTLAEKKKPSRKVAKDVKEDRVWLKIEKNKDDRQPVPIGVNGVFNLVERGKWVHIKREYLHVLQNAISYDIDPESGEAVGVASYPFQWQEQKPVENSFNFNS